MIYRVIWEIEELDANSPREAAEKALAIQRREGSSAVTFDVFDETGEMTRVDLDEDRCNCGAGGELGEHHKVDCPDHTPF